MANPAINPAMRLAADESGYLAYDPKADRLHELNATGALIVELCDGSRTIDEIRALAAPFLPEDRTPAPNSQTDVPSGQADIVARFISGGLESGLLVTANGASVCPQDLSAEELATLVNHLRETGQCDSALRCAKKLTQLAPDDPAHWHTLGGIASFAGHRAVAAEAYGKYLAARPEDASIAHLLIALRDEPPPPRASDDCVRLTFADFSSHYDSKMRDNLAYQAPERLAEFIGAEVGAELAGTSNLSIPLSILDIGCGTGLAGAALKSRASHLSGIDLSPEMIERARARDIYDSLEVAEITDSLANSRSEFDLIVACDCLVYFGDLTHLAQLAAARLKPGGHFAFTVERGEIFQFHLADSGRFTHHPDHICRIAEQSGLELVRLQSGYLRTEAGLDVTGLFALLRKSDTVLSR